MKIDLEEQDAPALRRELVGLDCNEDCLYVLKPVPGSEKYPRRWECREHGYPTERHSAFITSQSELERPNDYVSEIASPADVIEIGGKEVSLY